MSRCLWRAHCFLFSSNSVALRACVCWRAFLCEWVPLDWVCCISVVSFLRFRRFYSHLNTWFNFLTFVLFSFSFKNMNNRENLRNIYVWKKRERDTKLSLCESEIWCFKHAFFFVSLITCFYLYNPRTPFLLVFPLNLFHKKLQNLFVYTPLQ